MSFTLKYKDLNEKREIPNENYTIKDLLTDCLSFLQIFKVSSEIITLLNN